MRKPVVHQPSATVAAAERRQPAEQHGEDQDQQDADQERRQADADQRGREQDVRSDGVASQRRVDAERDADEAARAAPPRTTSSSVAGRRSLSSARHLARPVAATGRSRPAPRCRRSARTARRTAGRGRARARSRTRSSVVASWPSMNATGSPMKLKSPNAMNATTASRATDCRIRRRMKASMSVGCSPSEKTPEFEKGPRPRAHSMGRQVMETRGSFHSRRVRGWPRLNGSATTRFARTISPRRPAHRRARAWSRTGRCRRPPRR